MTELKRAIQKGIRFTASTEGQPALLGKYDGTVFFTDAASVVHRDRVWIRIGQGDAQSEVLAVASGMPNQPGLPVIVANRGGTPTVIGIDTYRNGGFDPTYPTSIAMHAFQHGRLGNDPLYVTGPAFLPLMAHPSASYDMTVVVETAFYRYLTTERVWTTAASSSLASYLPSTFLQTFIVLSLNRSTNALAVTESGVSSPYTSDVPFVESDVLTVVTTLADEHLPICAIRLYGTQTRILPNDIFMDCRMWGGEYPGTIPHTLDDLADVSISAPSTGDSLFYNGSSWVNAPPSTDFTDGITTPFVDYPLRDNAGNTFAGASATYPMGWTEADAPADTYIAESYWTIVGSAGETTWAYQKQGNYDFEAAVASNAYKSFWVGPVILKDGLYADDVDYLIGIYADNSGAPSTSKFVRAHIHWDQATGKWQIRGEVKDGTTETDGAYYDLARMPLQPFWLRFALKNDTNKATSVYLGATPWPQAHGAIQAQNASSSVTWGQAWFVFSLSRNTGINDTIMIGSIDYSADS